MKTVEFMQIADFDARASLLVVTFLGSRAGTFDVGGGLLNGERHILVTIDDENFSFNLSEARKVISSIERAVQDRTGDAFAAIREDFSGLALAMRETMKALEDYNTVELTEACRGFGTLQ
jgi:hypothetical protein